MTTDDAIELIWARRLLERLRIEGTSIVLRGAISDAALRAAVVEGRSFANDEGSYVVLKRAVDSSMPSAAPYNTVPCARHKKQDGKPRVDCHDCNDATHRATDSSGISPDDVRQMARWITDCVAERTSRGSWRDHGCARCVPGGPLTSGGFRCAVHIAEDALRNSSEFTRPAEEKKT